MISIRQIENNVWISSERLLLLVSTILLWSCDCTNIIIQEAIISSYGIRYQITNFYKNDDFESELKSRIKQNILEVTLVI